MQGNESWALTLKRPLPDGPFRRFALLAVPSLGEVRPLHRGRVDLAGLAVARVGPDRVRRLPGGVDVVVVAEEDHAVLVVADGRVPACLGRVADRHGDAPRLAA